MANPFDPDFVYSADELVVYVENIYRYKPGGYHPIILGDVIHSPTNESCYRVLHKLGHGTFSTVWIADHNRSDSTPRYVAVKVSTADGESANEADLLRSVPSPHIVPVFDSFDLEGPNGRHHVIVTEALLSFVEFLTIPRQVRTTKQLIWEIVKAVECLHTAGLVHGDLHLRNVGVTLPQIQTMTLGCLPNQLGDPVLIPTIWSDISISIAPLPTYLTAPSTGLKNVYERKTGEDPLEVHGKLFDFGSVRKENDAPRPVFCTRTARSPELRYAIDIDKREKPVIERASDIWAVGTLIFQIVSEGEPMFQWLGLSDMTDIASDPPPSHWDKSVFRSQPNGKPTTWWSDARSRLRQYCESDTDCDSLIRLLRRIFVFDAAARPTAAEILRDEWFASICIEL